MSGAASRAARTGHALAAGGLAGAILSVVALALPVRIGIWSDVEPVIVALHAAATIAAAGLALMIAAGCGRALGAVRHPYVLVLGAAAAFAVVTAPFARYPLASLIGEPETAEGALLYAEMAVFVAAGLALRAHRPTMRALVWGIAALSWATAAVAAWPGAGGLIFADWLAFYAIGVAVAVAAQGGTLRLGRLRLGGAPLGLAAALPALIVSQNLSAILLFLPGGLLWEAARWALARRAIKPGTVRRVGAVFAVLMPAAVIAAIAIVGPTGLVESIRSRARVDRVVLAQFVDTPQALAHGLGWGQAGETFVRHLNAAGATTYDRSWDLVFRDYLHTHDYALEALLSGGVGALALALLAVAMAPLWCRRRDVPLAVAFAVVLSGVAAFWFQLPMTVVAIALALAAIGRPVPAAPAPRARTAALVALPVVAACSCAAAAFLLVFAVQVRTALDGPFPARPTPAGACLGFPAEGWRGDIGLRYAMVRSYEALVRPGAAPDPTEIARAVALACEVDRRSARSHSALLASAGLLLRADVAFDARFRARDPAFARLLDDWAPRLRRFLAIAPDRSDLAIPYLGWRLTTGESQAVAAMAATLLARRPSDPVGLWFSGLVMIDSPDPARKRAALARLRAALDGGVERFLPIEPAQKSRILDLSRPGG